VQRVGSVRCHEIRDWSCPRRAAAGAKLFWTARGLGKSSCATRLFVRPSLISRAPPAFEHRGVPARGHVVRRTPGVGDSLAKSGRQRHVRPKIRFDPTQPEGRRDRLPVTPVPVGPRIRRHRCPLTRDCRGGVFLSAIGQSVAIVIPQCWIGAVRVNFRAVGLSRRRPYRPPAEWCHDCIPGCSSGVASRSRGSVIHTHVQSVEPFEGVIHSIAVGVREEKFGRSTRKRRGTRW
jgi:hypothetical protein